MAAAIKASVFCALCSQGDLRLWVIRGIGTRVQGLGLHNRADTLCTLEKKQGFARTVLSFGI